MINLIGDDKQIVDEEQAVMDDHGDKCENYRTSATTLARVKGGTISSIPHWLLASLMQEPLYFQPSDLFYKSKERERNREMK